jgi:two-component sensor histidine kinase
MADPPPAHPSLADNLALAMVASSDAPLLLLDGKLNVVAVSRSFCAAFRVDPATAPGQSVFELGDGEWDLPRLRSLLTGTASGLAAIDAYEIDLESEGRGVRRLVIKAQNLAYGDLGGNVRVLMTVSDITEARIADKLREDLLQEKAFLLQEVQHRVANSLQIIASVLMQSARNVQSEETRSYLKDAHSRVMSIATVQKQLARAQGGEVKLLPYLTQLCQSLGASMIRDHRQQSIEVTGDESSVGADVSISLGLIVTELVINALKHAYPESRAGKISVDYHAKGPNWTLSVGDDGVGMPSDMVQSPAGLGTSIVEALARQLRATVKVADGHPGTTVSIVHTQIAVASDTAEVHRAV